MTANPNDTLEKALALLGVKNDASDHHLSSLLRAIQAHAVFKGNDGLAYACEARINLIKVEDASVDT